MSHQFTSSGVRPLWPESDSNGLLWSRRMADSTIARHNPSLVQWHYEHGFMLKGIEQVWLATGEKRYWDFIQNYLDTLIDMAGNILTYRVEEYNLDQINAGKILFPLYRATADPRYRKALAQLREQLNHQPRTRSGSFWHKQIYPYQVWLDGLYMVAPFYAEYAQAFAESADFDDLIQQLIRVETYTRDPHSGLLYHAWDESKQQRWANPQTGCSPQFWGRAMGWYAMALVDTLDYLPETHMGRSVLPTILLRLIDAILGVQDEVTGLWYQILDQPGRPGNYLEASASCMFIYAIAKSVRKSYVPSKYLAAARRAYSGAIEQFVRIDEQGLANLEWTCSVAGLGGNPYRDGSYEYYISEPIATNDYKGIGAFTLAAVEIEKLFNPESGKAP